MPKLNCSVANCAYNAESCCCLSNVKVDGSSQTHHTEGTCCESFAEGGSGTNCSGIPAAYSEIDCQATSCTHNENCRCYADSIQVAGNGADYSGQTECSSFCKK